MSKYATLDILDVVSDVRRMLNEHGQVTERQLYSYWVPKESREGAIRIANLALNWE